MPILSDPEARQSLELVVGPRQAQSGVTGRWLREEVAVVLRSWTDSDARNVSDKDIDAWLRANTVFKIVKKESDTQQGHSLLNLPPQSCMQTLHRFRLLEKSEKRGWRLRRVHQKGRRRNYRNRNRRLSPFSPRSKTLFLQ